VNVTLEEIAVRRAESRQRVAANLTTALVLVRVGSPCVATLSERLLFGVFYRAFE